MEFLMIFSIKIVQHILQHLQDRLWNDNENKKNYQLEPKSLFAS